MRKSKLLGCLLVLLVVCCICSSCTIGNANAGAETTASGEDATTPGDSTTTKKPDTTTPTPTTPAPDPVVEPDPEDMPHDEKLLLGGVNISSYKIVYGRSQMEKTYESNTGKTAWEDLMNSGIKNYENMLQGENKKAEFDYESAVRLQQLIKERFGYTLEVVKDSDAPTESRYEILVGYTDRAATTNMRANANLYAELEADKALKIDQYICSFDTYLVEIKPEEGEEDEPTADLEPGLEGDEEEPEIQYKETYTTQYVICGGSYGATWHAIDAIEAYFDSLDAESLAEGEPAVIDLSSVPAEDESEQDEETPAAADLANAGKILDAYDFKAVATIGDSITRGSQGFPDGNGFGDDTGFALQIAGKAKTIYLEQFLSWPATLQRELWKDYLICNYGQGNATMRDPDPEVYPDPGPFYYNDHAKFANLLTESNREDFEFDLVLIMLGTNDAGRNSGASKWNAHIKDEYIQEAENLLIKISEGSPNAKFVLMNAPHRCDGKSASELNDAAIRELQERTVREMQAKGYDIYCYDMESYTVDHLIAEGSVCAEKAESSEGLSDEEILELEKEVHGDYYNIKTDTGTPDTTHPNYRGYGKIAEGMIDLVQHMLDGAEAPEYMIDVNATEEEEEPAA